MRFQALPYSCGAAAVVNTARVFGKRVDERRIRTMAATSPEGTSPEGIMAALRGIGYSATIYEGKKSSQAWQWLNGALVHGSVIILSVDLWQHWVACIGLNGDRVILIDSANTVNNLREHGVQVLPKAKLLKRWRSSRSSTENVYFAICATKPKKTKAV
jgi:ABC-type bacteriocin/lantibiotic exporter with double-glycine peptidase domain